MSAVNILQELATALEARVASASERVVAIRNSARQHASGFLWHTNAIVASEQVVGAREEYEIASARGTTTTARVVGRDPGTNLIVLQATDAPDTPSAPAGTARPGALAIALGADVEGRPTSRIGAINAAGPQWYSRAGGRIDARITLDIRLGRTEEGGPVVDAAGALLGMSTLGFRGEVLVIPHATLDRIVPQLLRDGRVARGWLGVALQPVAVPDALVDAAGQASAMMVMSVVPDGPSARAGVAAGDLLLTLDGQSVRGVRQLAAHLGEDSLGRSIELRVIRGGQIIGLQAVISART